MQPIPHEQLPFSEGIEVMIQGPDLFQVTLPVAFLWVTGEGVCFVEAGYYLNASRPSAQCVLGPVEIEADTIVVTGRDGSRYRFCRPSNWLVRTILRQWREWCRSRGLTMEIERERLWSLMLQSMRSVPTDRV